MGLTLGIRKGTKFYIDDRLVEVVKVDGYKSAVLRLGEQEVEVFDDKSKELMPDVFVYCGVPSEETMRTNLEKQKRAPRGTVPDLISRLVIDAPREIVILRSKLYNGRKAEPRI